MRRVDPASVAICTIHGNSPGYTGEFAVAHPWPALQLDMLRKYTESGYRVYGYGNRIISEHEQILRAHDEVEYISSDDVIRGTWDHVWPLRNWLTRRAFADGFQYVVHLDSDAFPTRPDWLQRYVGAIDEACPVVAVQRTENDYVHSDRCFLIFSVEGFHRWVFDFSHVGVPDAGAAISATLEANGVGWWALNRTNAVDLHPVIAALYDDRIYHHGAGSRVPLLKSNAHRFRTDQDFAWRETTLHRELMSRLFEDPEQFLAELRGNPQPGALAEETG